MGTFRIGTSGWSYKDWDGVFYPAGTPATQYLAHYAEQFDIVEVDSSYYRIPSVRTVAGWVEKTPDPFRFALKAPKTITHEKVLEDCQPERDALLAALEPLGKKLHCVLLQFGYFNKKAFARVDPFLERLDAFLDHWPTDVRIAVEIRNKGWLKKEFFDLLRAHRAAFVACEHAWMPPVETVLTRPEAITTDFLYLRLIGDRQEIERFTTRWDRVVIDRSERIGKIIAALAKVLPKADVIAFVNNHFAGHGPKTARTILARLAAAPRPE